VVDRLTTLLCALARHELGDLVRRDRHSTVRVAVPQPRFADYVNLTCDQIRRYGAADPQVLRSLMRMLRRVAEVTDDPGRRATLARHARLVLATGEERVVLAEDLDGLRRLYARVPGVDHA
jgi:uncharacterized membrane protein